MGVPGTVNMLSRLSFIRTSISFLFWALSLFLYATCKTITTSTAELSLLRNLWYPDQHKVTWEEVDIPPIIKFEKSNKKWDILVCAGCDSWVTTLPINISTKCTVVLAQLTAREDRLSLSFLSKILILLFLEILQMFYMINYELKYYYSLLFDKILD